ncbi:MAG TPA: lytic transglycosylase domain-containing protein [Burkholderiales bacterium]
MMKRRKSSLWKLHPAVVAVLLAFAPGTRADAIYVHSGPDGSVSFSNVPMGPGWEPVAGTPPAPVLATARAPYRTHPERERYAPLVAQAAADTGLPEDLLHAVIQAESNYNHLAVSSKGATGLMQLMPETARQYGVADAREPGANLMGGARYLRDLLDQFNNDLPVALAAYNAGPKAVQKSGNAIPPYAETRRYVPKVLDLYQRGGRMTRE